MIDDNLPRDEKSALAPARRGRGIQGVALAVVLGACAFAPAALTGQLGKPAQAAPPGNFCTSTAKAMRTACRNDTEDDFWMATAICINLSDPAEEADCLDEADGAKVEGREECGDVFGARLDLCDLVGEERYDPDWDPADFVDPNDIGNGVDPNPYFPLIPGTQWILEGGDETITIVVTDRTKLIDGVDCRVVNDVVEDDGKLVEDTDDWYAQDYDGNVWYCGEMVSDFEFFEGDVPQTAERVSIDGSFKVGRDGAKGGILILANPSVGDAYRQESALGDAEDAVEVLSLAGDETSDFVDCDNNCLVTRDFSPLDPEAEENKYYLSGIGLILEVDEEGNRTELVDFSTP